MNHLAIVRIVCIIGIVMSGLMVATGVLAAALDEFDFIFPFLLAAAVTGVPGAVILYLTNKPKQKTRATDGLAVAFLFWAIIPIFSAIPFIPLAGTGGWMAAYHEAVSCVTTTGHSALDMQGAPLPASILVWRALLHLIGTIASITIAATVLAAMNLGGPGIHKSRFFTIPEGSFFDTVPKIIRVSTVMTCTVVLALASLMLIIGVAPREALSGAVSAVSTGLVDPNAATTAPTIGWLHASVLAIGLVLGSLGLVVLDNLSKGQFLKVTGDPETITFFGSIAIVASLAILAGLPLLQSTGWALSSISTSGMALSDPDRFARIPLVVILFPVLIGGSALSAAGGIKLARLIILSKRVFQEFSQLGYRGSVQTFTFRGRIQSERTVMGVWVYLVGYIMACGMGIFLLSLFGMTFDDSIRGAIGSISNAGHVINDISDLHGIGQFCIILGMILGRLEIIALVPVLTPSFWAR